MILSGIMKTVLGSSDEEIDEVITLLDTEEEKN